MLPTILEYKEQRGYLPKCLTFSLAALIAFYRTDETNDGEEIMAFMKDASVSDILKKEQYWGQDLSFMKDEVEKYYESIQKDGVGKTIEGLLRG